MEAEHETMIDEFTRRVLGAINQKHMSKVRLDQTRIVRPTTVPATPNRRFHELTLSVSSVTREAEVRTALTRASEAGAPWTFSQVATMRREMQTPGDHYGMLVKTLVVRLYPEWPLDEHHAHLFWRLVAGCALGGAIVYAIYLLLLPV
jgi:hypothetical protein